MLCCSSLHRVIIVVLLVSASLRCHANAPDWVQQAASREQGKYPADTNAVVLLDDTSMTVNESGQAEMTHRRVVRILRPKGREEARFGMYLRAGDKLQSLHAWS